jgi:hypothetical protein
VGCERAAVHQAYPPDPLLLSKKPVEVKAETSRPLLATSEPTVPPLPVAALASAPRERLGDVATRAALTQGPPLPAPAAGPTTSTSAKPVQDIYARSPN